MGVTFNSVHSSTYGLELKTVRPLSPGLSDSYMEIPGRAGSVLVPGKPKDRYITVEFGFVAGSKALFRSQIWNISAWLNTDERKPLVFDDEPDKTYLAKVEGQIPLEQLFILGKFSVIFRCDPFAYGQEVTSNFIADSVKITNAGTESSPVKINATFTSGANEFKVTLGSDYVRVVNDFVVTNTLEIDTETGIVLINGARAMDKLDWQNSKFFKLATGENNLAITPTSVCTATAKHKPRWY